MRTGLTFLYFQVPVLSALGRPGLFIGLSLVWTPQWGPPPHQPPLSTSMELTCHGAKPSRPTSAAARGRPGAGGHGQRRTSRGLRGLASLRETRVTTGDQLATGPTQRRILKTKDFKFCPASYHPVTFRMEQMPGQPNSDQMKFCQTWRETPSPPASTPRSPSGKGLLKRSAQFTTLYRL